jgi:ACS family tartrate transporter-like MFS transporter
MGFGDNMPARVRITPRLLPFVFLLYLINFIDRVNVSFAALRMKEDLGFSDSVYGFGASLFFLTYMLLEVPGAIIVERWSARVNGLRALWSPGGSSPFSPPSSTQRNNSTRRVSS